MDKKYFHLYTPEHLRKDLILRICIGCFNDPPLVVDAACHHALYIDFVRTLLCKVPVQPSGAIEELHYNSTIQFIEQLMGSLAEYRKQHLTDGDAQLTINVLRQFLQSQPSPAFN
jgi:hypothetical protein